MVVTSLSELLPYVDNGLWPMLERFDFRPAVLGCFPGPYDALYSKPADARDQQASGGCHSDIFVLLRDMMKRDYNVHVVSDRRQKRLAFSGPNGTQFDFILRKASAKEGGFGTSRVGIVTQEASLFHEDPQAFLFNPPHPNRKGIFLAHELSNTLKNHIDVWLAYEWLARDGSEFIECERCAHIGSVPFFLDGLKPVQPEETTGDDPDLA